MDKILDLLIDIGDFIRFYPLFNLDEIILLELLIMVLLLVVIYRFHKDAKEKALKGDERKKFMSDCLKK